MDPFELHHKWNILSVFLRVYLWSVFRLLALVIIKTKETRITIGRQPEERERGGGLSAWVQVFPTKAKFGLVSFQIRQASLLFTQSDLLSCGHRS